MSLRLLCIRTFAPAQTAKQDCNATLSKREPVPGVFYSSNGYIVKIMMDYSLMTDFDSNLFYKETFVLSVHLHH